MVFFNCLILKAFRELNGTSTNTLLYTHTQACTQHTKTQVSYFSPRWRRGGWRCTASSSASPRWWRSRSLWRRLQPSGRWWRPCWSPRPLRRRPVWSWRAHVWQVICQSHCNNQSLPGGVKTCWVKYECKMLSFTLTTRGLSFNTTGFLSWKLV